MRFAVTAVAFAGAVLAGKAPESTVYSTDYITITSCAPTVTNCPAHSTKVITTVYPITTSTIFTTSTHTVTSCGPEITNCPAHSTVVVTDVIAVSTTVCPVTETSKPVYYNTTSSPIQISTVVPVSTSTYSAEAETFTVYPTSIVAPACPTYSVKTISTSVTTVIPTVIYSTVSIPCPTPTWVAAPTGSLPGWNTTTGSKPVTAGSANLAVSGLFAVVAGLAAVALA